MNRLWKISCHLFVIDEVELIKNEGSLRFKIKWWGHFSILTVLPSLSLFIYLTLTLRNFLQVTLIWLLSSLSSLSKIVQMLIIHFVFERWNRQFNSKHLCFQTLFLMELLANLLLSFQSLCMANNLLDAQDSVTSVFK